MSPLRSSFGEHHEEIWRRLADEVHGRFVQEGTWQAGKVRIDLNDWHITLDVYTIPGLHSEERFTRFRAPFVNPDGFRLTVYRETVFTRLAGLFGMQDIKTGDPQIDSHYVIQGTDEARVRGLLSHPEIRRLMKAQPDFHLHVDDDDGYHADTFPEGVDELYFEVPGVVDDLDRLKQCYELFALVLRALCEMGSAYGSDPEMA